MNEKICRDCKFAVQRNDVPYLSFQCTKTLNLVTGDPAWDCSSHRRVGWLSARIEGRCGREGRWFEPKAEGR